MKHKILLYLLTGICFCLNLISCDDDETNASDDTLRPEYLIVGKWQLIEYTTPGAGTMFRMEDIWIEEYTTDGKRLTENSEEFYRFDVDKLCLSELSKEEPYIVYTYEFDEDRLQLERFSTTFSTEEANTLPILLIYQRVDDSEEEIRK